MKKLISLIMVMLLALNLAGCGGITGSKTRLLAAHLSYYADGGLSYFYEYSYEFDKQGRLVEENEYQNGYLYTTAETVYDSDGTSVRTVTDVHGKIKSVEEYDKDGIRLSESTYGYNGEVEKYCEFDKDGKITLKESSGSYNYTVRYEYDESGNLVRTYEESRDENGNLKSSYEEIYDETGRRIRQDVTDAEGNTYTSMEAKIEKSGNHRTILECYEGYVRYRIEEEYDENGNLLTSVSYTEDDGEILQSHEYTYDDKNRVIEDVYYSMYDSSTSHYEYADEGYLCKESRTYERPYSSVPYGDGSDSYMQEFTDVTFYNEAGEETRTQCYMGTRITGYSEYIYEDVKVRPGAVYDYTDNKRELDPRSTIVY